MSVDLKDVTVENVRELLQSIVFEQCKIIVGLEERVAKLEARAARDVTVTVGTPSKAEMEPALGEIGR